MRKTITCNDCEAIIQNSVIKPDYINCNDEDYPICEECMDNYTGCSDCGITLYREDETIKSDDNGYYCEGCWQENAEPLEISAATIDSVTSAPAISGEALIKRGYRLINSECPAGLYTDTADTLGWRINNFGGDNDGRSLGIDDLKAGIAGFLKKHKKVYAALTSCGQFQVYVGLFIKSESHA